MAIQLSVKVGVQAALKQRVIREIDSANYMTWLELWKYI